MVSLKKECPGCGGVGAYLNPPCQCEECNGRLDCWYCNGTGKVSKIVDFKRRRLW